MLRMPCVVSGGERTGKPSGNPTCQMSTARARDAYQIPMACAGGSNGQEQGSPCSSMVQTMSLPSEAAILAESAPEARSFQMAWSLVTLILFFKKEKS